MSDLTVAVIEFPGSNCVDDAEFALGHSLGLDCHRVWHRSTRLPKSDLVFIPGGFSYGDYLRAGALASHSPVVAAIKEFADRGGWVIGVCNGFQILTESGILPGVLLPNKHGRFICRRAEVRLQKSVGKLDAQTCLSMDIAHAEGRYFIDEVGLARLWDNNQVLFRYEYNGESKTHNGSTDEIAGITSRSGRVSGMMPHPERVLGKKKGDTDGTNYLKAVLENI